MAGEIDTGGGGMMQEVILPEHLEIDGLTFNGYTKQGFIQACAIRMFAAVDFNNGDKNPTVEANKCVQRAMVLANILNL